MAENFNTWIRTAKEHKETSRGLLNSGFPDDSFQKIIYAVEVYLKAVLVSEGENIHEYKHHRQKDLFKEIKKKKYLEDDLLVELSSHYEPGNKNVFGYINMNEGREGVPHEDCAVHQVTGWRYPFGDSTPKDMLEENTEYIEGKIFQAEQIFDILDRHFSREYSEESSEPADHCDMCYTS